MLVAKMIGQVGNGSQGVTLEFGKRWDSLALIGIYLILTRPAIGAAERIHIIGLHHVVACRQSEVQTWDSKISLLIEHRGSPSLRCAIFAAKHDFHQIGVLYLCIFMAIVQAEDELVGPCLIYHTQLKMTASLWYLSWNRRNHASSLLTALVSRSIHCVFTL